MPLKIFERPTLDAFDDRKDYGEVRINSIGLLDDGTCVNVTHTERAGDIRIISARCASERARNRYLELVGDYLADCQVAPSASSPDEAEGGMSDRAGFGLVMVWWARCPPSNAA